MFELGILLVLLCTGFFVGQYLEKRHYRSIIDREEQLNRLPAIASKVLSESLAPCDTQLVAANVVISVDYFKKFVAALRVLAGGRVTSFESLIDRARREALLRMKQQAKDMGAEYVFNVKMETSTISRGRNDSIGSVEVLAWGTAVIRH